MPATPVIWTDAFQVNTIDGDAGGDDQQFQSVVQLSNGNTLYVWESNSSGAPGAAAGFDIVGQIYDLGGNKVGGEIVLNTIYAGDDEQRPQIVARAGGGFAVAYEDNASATDRSIRGEVYNASGTLTGGASVANDIAPAGFSTFLNAHLAGSPLSPIAGVAYVVDNGSGAQSVAFRTWNTAENTLGAVKTAFSGSPSLGGGIDSLDIARLDNGRFVVAISDADSFTDSDIDLAIYSSGAVLSGNASVASGTTRNDEVRVAGLDGSDFVVTWTSNQSGSDHILARLFDDDGVAIGGPIDVTASHPGAQSASAVARITGGNFVIAWHDTGLNVIRAQTFDPAGAKIGDVFKVQDLPAGAATSLTVTNLLDGRFTIGWTSDTAGDHDIGAATFDPRDAVPVGTNGNNTIVGLAGDDIIAGFDGFDNIYGGKGDDTLIGGKGADTIDGGLGNDTASYQGSANGVVVYLQVGTVTGGDGEGDALRSIENVAGSQTADVIYGDGNANILYGMGGIDLLFGGGGSDRLFAGGGVSDYLWGGDGADIHDGTGSGGALARYDDAAWGDLVISMVDPSQGTGVAAGDTFINISGIMGGAGKDTIIGDGGDTSLSGREGDDTLIGGGGIDYLAGNEGNDVLDGGAGNDTLIGGIGDDTYVDVQLGDTVGELAGEGIDTFVGDGDVVLSSANSENVKLTGTANTLGGGNEIANVVTGNAGNNTLYGYGGKDTLDGGDGTDTLFGGNDDDTYVNPTGDTIAELAEGGAADLVKSNVSYSLASVANVENLTLTGGGKANGIGNGLDNKIVGNANINILNGGNGNDTLNGGAGADELKGGTGDDTYVNPTGDIVTELAGQGLHDKVLSAVSFNLTTVSQIEDLTLAGADAVNAIGNQFANILTGNTGANIINGGKGDDTIDGGRGNDTLNGGDGFDLFRFQADNSGNDRIDGFDKVKDSFDLFGGAFTAVNENNGDSKLTHGGGTVVISGVTGLTLDQWNALVDDGGARHAGSPDARFAGHGATSAAEPAFHGHYAAAHADFIFA